MILEPKSRYKKLSGQIGQFWNIRSPFHVRIVIKYPKLDETNVHKKLRGQIWSFPGLSQIPISYWIKLQVSISRLQVSISL